MSKEQEEAKALNKEIHKVTKAQSPLVQKWRDFVRFITFLTRFTFAVLIVACGAYTAYKGIKSTYTLAHIGLTVAGVAASIEGLCLVWRAVIKLEK